jgi:hypothetical protein
VGIFAVWGAPVVLGECCPEFGGYCCYTGRSSCFRLYIVQVDLAVMGTWERGWQGKRTGEGEEMRAGKGDEERRRAERGEWRERDQNEEERTERVR